MPKPSEYQEKVRHGNRMYVLSCLEERLPVRFKDLKNDSGLSPMGLSKILKDLEEKGWVKHFLHDRRPAYEITKKGILLISNTMTLGIISDQIKKDGGKYFHDYSKIRPSFESKGISWGIKDDVVINKDIEKELKPILREVITNTIKDIYQKFPVESKTKDIHFEKLTNKKIIIGFTIDFNALVKSIKDFSHMRVRKIPNLQRYKKSVQKGSLRRAKRK